MQLIRVFPVLLLMCCGIARAQSDYVCASALTDVQFRLDSLDGTVHIQIRNPVEQVRRMQLDFRIGDVNPDAVVTLNPAISQLGFNVQYGSQGTTFRIQINPPSSGGIPPSATYQPLASITPPAWDFSATDAKQFNVYGDSDQRLSACYSLGSGAPAVIELRGSLQSRYCPDAPLEVLWESRDVSQVVIEFRDLQTDARTQARLVDADDQQVIVQAPSKSGRYVVRVSAAEDSTVFRESATFDVDRLPPMLRMGFPDASGSGDRLSVVSNTDWITIQTRVVQSSDNCQLVDTARLESISRNRSPAEPGVDVEDATLGTMDLSFRIRANDQHQGRDVYHIVYTARDQSGNIGTDSLEVTIDRVVGVPGLTHARQHIVSSAAPVPSASSVDIQYQLPSPTHVRLQVLNTAGIEVFTLVDAHQPSGTYTVRWQGATTTGTICPTGLYFYRLETGLEIATGKIVLVR